jgi:2-polyprenyl-3-methyl-5-hydroxy-6-metoxy-1,4-benzoquinol methylase
VSLLRKIVHAQGQDLDQAVLLDVGCGAGTTDRHLASQVKSLHGVDVSEEMVSVARKHVADGEFLHYDGKTLPFPSGSFDVVIAICVLHHVPQPDQTSFLRELVRVTRSGGVIAVFEHNPANPLTRRAVRGCELDVGVELLRAKDVERLLAGTGARVVSRDYFLFTPFGGRLGSTVDQLLRWLPFGGQHVVVARSG